MAHFIPGHVVVKITGVIITWKQHSLKIFYKRVKTLCTKVSHSKKCAKLMNDAILKKKLLIPTEMRLSRSTREIGW